MKKQLNYNLSLLDKIILNEHLNRNKTIKSVFKSKEEAKLLKKTFIAMLFITVSVFLLNVYLLVFTSPIPYKTIFTIDYIWLLIGSVCEIINSSTIAKFATSIDLTSLDELYIDKDSNHTNEDIFNEISHRKQLIKKQLIGDIVFLVIAIIIGIILFFVNTMNNL